MRRLRQTLINLKHFDSAPYLTHVVKILQEQSNSAVQCCVLKFCAYMFRISHIFLQNTPSQFFRQKITKC